jgi:zinc/manganese transport system permease protein
VVISLVTIWAAIALSYSWNWPVGFFVGVLGAASYAIGRGWSARQRSVAATQGV